MEKRQAKPASAPEPADEKPDKETDRPESEQGFPPGVSFDTEAGRQAQGMHPDIQNRRAGEKAEREKTEEECEGKES